MSDLVIGGLGSEPRVILRESIVIAELSELALLSAEQDVLIPMALWLSSEPQLIEHRASALLLLEAGDDVMALKNRLDDVPAIAIRFSDFNDGRGYSTAVLLRERLGFRGALRAVGDVLRDQLFYLLRCGFDQFVPRADKSTEDFLGGYRDFSQVYQRSATSLPLYRRARSIQKAAP